jgi:hypothetical protein
VVEGASLKAYGRFVAAFVAFVDFVVGALVDVSIFIPVSVMGVAEGAGAIAGIAVSAGFSPAREQAAIAKTAAARTSRMDLSR